MKFRYPAQNHKDDQQILAIRSKDLTTRTLHFSQSPSKLSLQTKEKQGSNAIWFLNVWLP